MKKIILLILIFCSYSFAQTFQFTNGGLLVFNGTLWLGTNLPTAAQMNGASSFIRVARNTTTASSAISSNTAFTLTNGTGVFADGTGTLKVFIKYRILTL